MTGRLDLKRFLVRFLLEMGPLLVFFAVTLAQGILWGTAAFMAATGAAFVHSLRRERRVPVMPLVGLLFTLVFGGLTLAFDDPVFIMVRPTLFNGLAAGVLIALMARGRLILRDNFGAGVPLPTAAWRQLTWRVAVFFVFLAAFNEATWRLAPLEVWIALKTFLLPPLNVLFLLANWPYVRRHAKAAGAEGE